MKNLLAGSIILLCAMGISYTALADSANKCSITLTNVGVVSVEFAGNKTDPGSPPTVKPKESATLSGDYMVGAGCDKKGKNCSVWVRMLDDSGSREVINGVPRGATILYAGPGKYVVKPDPNARCGS